MRAYTLEHLSDRNLLQALTALVARERATTAELLAHIAEVDARRLYAPAGYASMHAYCVGELRLSEDSAFRRIRAARTGRQFPMMLDAVAEGRLSLTAVILLTPYLTRENAAGLMQAATHGTRADIEAMLARRFPRPELMPMVEPVPAQQIERLAPAPVEKERLNPATTCGVQLAPAPVAVPTTNLAPIAPGRYALHVTISQATHEKLRHAQALLSHKLPSGDLATTLDLALEALIEKLEKRKFAKTGKPRPPRRSTSANPRHIPAHVKRAVWQRDGGRCTFVSANGHRCNARRFLEFDHVQPVARAGHASVAGMRLRCQAHNQYEAERMFGAGFMRAKLAEAQTQGSATSQQSPAAPPDHDVDVLACLSTLGVRGEQARRATAVAAALPNATVEARIRAALRTLGPRARTTAPDIRCPGPPA